MRVTTRISWDLEGRVLEHEWYEYAGEVARCKGGDTAKAQMDEQNRLQQQQLDAQNKTLGEIKSGVGKYLSGDIGFSPAEMSMLQSQFLNNNSLDYANAGSAVRDALAAKGQGNGDLPVGGTYTRGLSGLLGSQAAQHGAGILNLGVADAQQALTNKFNAASVLSGNAATLANNVGTFGSGASSALDSFIKGSNSGLLFNLMTGLGQGLGQGVGGGLGKGLSGGLGKMFSGGGSSGGGGDFSNFGSGGG